MRNYSKEDVEFHADHYGPPRPAVNVKVHHFPRASTIQDRFNCSEDIAEQAIQYAVESAQEAFWGDIEGLAKEVLGSSVKVWQEGRSGGWLVVDGLPDVESWDAVQLAKWRSFEAQVKSDIAWRLADEQIIEDIDANRWAEDGAERYNFTERADGDHCIVDLKASGELCRHCGKPLT